MKKYIFVAIMFVVFGACNRLDKKQETADTRVNGTTTIQTAEQQSLNYHDRLMSSFNPSWEVEEPNPADYPFYYGGSFINNDGKFVVCIVGDPGQQRSAIAAIIGSDDFLTERCTYSYREMMEVMDRIDQFLSNSAIAQDHPVMANFAGASADVLQNRVVVKLLTVNEPIIQAFKRDISNSPAVKFEVGEMPVM